MSTGTGKVDKNGIEMKVGDVVHFKANGISGKGFVYLANEPDGLPEKFRIKDTRQGKNFLRTYPYYPDATYRIDNDATIDEKKVEVILKMVNDEETKLYGSRNSGNFVIPLSKAIKIIQEA
ncbi:MAG: hypothetical protein HP047_04665 [Lachnospira sp.]|jgi:hypothetical protein|nr:hypothetical protein [Lachnospira sp.]